MKLEVIVRKITACVCEIDITDGGYGAAKLLIEHLTDDDFVEVERYIETDEIVETLL